MPTRLSQFDTAISATKKMFSATNQQSRSSSKETSASDSDSSHGADLLNRHNKTLDSQNQNDIPSFAKLRIHVESPPLISFGSPEESSGALFAGQFHVHILSSLMIFDILEISLIQINTIRKSIVQCRCKDCMSNTKVLRTWAFTKQSPTSNPKTLSEGKHIFHFSHVFAGCLPASTCSHHAMIDYQFVATARTQNGEVIIQSHTLKLQRAMRAERDYNKETTQQFPPTSITASTLMSPVCYMNQELAVHLQLSGLRNSQPKAETQWSLKRLLWRIEEQEKISSIDCRTTNENEEPAKIEITKLIGSGEVSWSKNPWKPKTQAGEVSADFNVKINPRKAIPSVQSNELNLDVKHNLIVDMLVIEEYYSKTNPSWCVPTGQVRLLRLPVSIFVAKCGDTGLPWDEELPPMYEQVPGSPPEYLDKIDEPPTYGSSQSAEGLSESSDDSDSHQ